MSDYRRQAVMGVLPFSGVPLSDVSEVYLYCDNVGVDRLNYRKESGISLAYLPKGYSTGEKLADAYAAVTKNSGWSLVGTGDAWLDTCGLTILFAGTRFCVGTGVLFCKMIDGVTTHFTVTSASRPDLPNNPAPFGLDIFARRDAASCASSLGY